ncbi:MAG: hypothetical protein ACPGUC_08755 [Gammaproteobacteria bacterium]
MTPDHQTPLSAETQRMLEALRTAVDKALERKRQLGQYAVVWKDGRVVRLEAEEQTADPNDGIAAN